MSTTLLWGGAMVGRGFHYITFSPAAAVTTRGLLTPQGVGIQDGRSPLLPPNCARRELGYRTEGPPCHQQLSVSGTSQGQGYRTEA